ncbi:retrograde regulation protein 2 [Polychaeton citri CBS 116435]|uniref:Retrograde regulation protein 2 n=1 Tax=Polychaeton citri CBS 116435 TaxID=1314669 RepID=A0A9P4PX35_9PEZI|nr:retrograde regulation protein 2 [Polychaeton citri CBS 116435]
MPSSLDGLSDSELNKLGRKATFKMDIVIMPCMVIMYILNYLDRQNIASAKLAGIEEDLNMNDTQYQTAVSILFVGYILMQIPSNMVLGKIKYPGVYISLAMATWGAVGSCMAAVNSFSGIIVTRFFIGLVEAVFFPGALYFLSMFYSRQQYALRAAILFSGSQLGNAFGGLFAIAIMTLDGAHGLAGWRWLFLIEGVMTVGLGIVFAFILPNSPASFKAFTQQERDLVRWRYEQDQGQKHDASEVSSTQGLLMALRDPKTWMLLALLYAVYISAAVTNFFPSVVGTLGYSRNITYALTAPPYILSCIIMMINGWHSDKKQERYLHVAIPLVVGVIANVIAVATLNTAARYVAMMLMPGSLYSATTVILSWITGTLAQPAPKRAAAIAIINASCNTPNIWTPFIYTGAPRYLVAFLVNMAAAAVAVLVATYFRFYLRRQNIKLDNGVDTGRSGPTPAQRIGGFRYLL